MDLTKAQQKILDFIRERCEQSQPPSYRDIQSQFGYGSVKSAQDHVAALFKKGALEKNEPREGGRARGLVPAGFTPNPFRRISIYGEIVAGSPVEANQMEIGSMMIPQKLVKGPCYALRVKGDSMINAGILEGDHVIVAPKQPVKNGDIVVALVNGENTLKRFVKKDGVCYLVPENPRLKPIEVRPDELEVQGKVIGLQRILG